MTHWGNVLREARTRARLTQEELAAQVPISVSYIRKMETGLLGPPTREKAEKLADALNITDPENRNAFFRAAEVGNDEDMEGFRLVKVEDDEAVKAKQQASYTPMPINPAIAIQRLPFNSPGAQINRLIASRGYSEEKEKKVGAAVVEIVEQVLALIETQSG